LHITWRSENSTC